MNRAQTKAATRRPCSWRSTRVNGDIAIQRAGNSGISAVSLSHRTNGLACRRALERADKSRHPQAMQVAVSTRKPRYCDSTRRQLRHFSSQFISPQICLACRRAGRCQRSAANCGHGRRGEFRSARTSGCFCGTRFAWTHRRPKPMSTAASHLSRRTKAQSRSITRARGNPHRPPCARRDSPHRTA